MSGATPWSVKGIDAKAREVAKDLARRSGMTLGEWLNLTILEGGTPDLGAQGQARPAPQDDGRRDPYYRPANPAQSDHDSADWSDGQGDDYDPYDAQPLSHDPRHVARATHALRSQSYQRPAPTARPEKENGRPYATPYARNEARRRSAEAELGRGYRAPIERPKEEASQIGRVASVLESLGDRLEVSETRSATAVRGVSHAVESLLARLERSEARFAEQEQRLTGQVSEFETSIEQISRSQDEAMALVDRLGDAEHIIETQAQRLDGLTSHLREERERVAALEAKLLDPQALQSVKAVEGALGKLANQLYEDQSRSRATLDDVRKDMIGISHRLSQVENQNPQREAQALIDQVVTQLAHRLDGAEARTSGAIKNLEQVFASLDKRLSRAEERGDVTDPEAVQSLSRLAGNLSREVDNARAEMLRAFEETAKRYNADGRLSGLEQGLARVAQQSSAAEQRSARAIEKLGHDVSRLAEQLSDRVANVEKSNQAFAVEVQTSQQGIDAKLSQFEGAQAQGLQRLGAEIARISERLTQRLNESESRTVEAFEAMSEQFVQDADKRKTEISEQIRQSEALTQKIISEAQARIDSRLNSLQQQTLLAGSGLLKSATDDHADTSHRYEAPKTSNHQSLDIDLPDPFASAHDLNQAQSANADLSNSDTDRFDLTGSLLGGFVEAPIDNTPQPSLAPEAVNEPVIMPSLSEPSLSEPSLERDLGIDDADPFAEIDLSRKTAPKSEQTYAERLDTSHLDTLYEDVDDVLAEEFEAAHTPLKPQAPITRDAEMDDFGLFEDEAKSPPSSTRDALMAARAAVRASLESSQIEDKKPKATLKLGPSRPKAEEPKTAKSQVIFYRNSLKLRQCQQALWSY